MAKQKNVQINASEETDSLQKAFEIFESMDKNYSAFKSQNTVIDCVDTGSPKLNSVIGIGGYPRRRVTQLYGSYGSGKSFLCMIGVANALKEDPKAIAVWFDAENSFNYEWAKKLGIWDDDPRKCRVKVIQGNKGIPIFERLVGKIKKDKFGSKKVQNGILDYIKEGALNCPIIVIDSIASIRSPREEDAPVGGLTVAALALFLNAELKRVSDMVEEANTALLIINQVRQTMDEGGYGDKYHFPGGESLKHLMSLNLYVERDNKMESLITTEDKNRNTLIGQKVKIVVKKSRFGPAPRACETTLLFTEGCGYNKIGIVNVEEEVVDLAVSANIIEVSGSWFTLPGVEKPIQGSNKVVAYLKENKDLYEMIKNKLKDIKIATTETIEEGDGEIDVISELLSGKEEVE